jgi:hypothetical protein
MRWRRALLALAVPAFASLGGCELIAGVRDITETDDAGTDARRSDLDVFIIPMDARGSTGDAPASDVVTADVVVSDGTVAEAAVGAEAGVEAGPPEAGVDAPSDTGTKQEAAADAPAADAPSGDAGVTYVLIDNMEGNTGEISAPKGGTGYWFTYNDMTVGGTETPATTASPFPDSMLSPVRTVPAPFSTLPGGSSTSTYAAEVSGSGFADYAGMGFNFKNPTTATYDASAYVGFVFWGRTGGTTTDGVVRILVPDANTDPRGMVCTTCYEYLGADLSFTATWQQFTVMYTDLAQQNPGVPVETTLDAAAVYGVQFQVSTKAPPDEAFDILVDDIYFIKP